jgi:hypothetical protein
LESSNNFSLFCVPSWKLPLFLFSILHCFTLPYNSPVTFLPNSYDLKTNLMFSLQFPNSWVVFLHQVTSMGRELFFLPSCFLSTHTWLLALSLLFASTSKPSPLWTHNTIILLYHHSRHSNNTTQNQAVALNLNQNGLPYLTFKFSHSAFIIVQLTKHLLCPSSNLFILYNFSMQSL